jgi:P-type E1-E2 ATPase
LFPYALKRVFRDGKTCSIAASELVPGDVVVLEPGAVHADMVILRGENISVDESALTGEGTPVIKKAVDAAHGDTKYNQKRHAASTISAGTHVLEIDESQQAIALVMATSSLTTKGKLLTDVFSYRRKISIFDEEATIVFCILLVQAVVMIALIFYWLSDQLVYAWYYGKSSISFKPKSSGLSVF